jgi:hypothetical protein
VSINQQAEDVTVMGREPSDTCSSMKTAVVQAIGGGNQTHLD